MAVERRLRSYDSEKHKSDSIFFNFEKYNPLIYDDKRILIKSGTSNYKQYKELNENQGRTIDRKINFSIQPRKHKLPRKSGNKKDVLNDSIFQLFHRRMRNKERSLVNLERAKNLSEIDNLSSYVDELEQNDWERKLPTITYIHDTRNKQEMLYKRQVTLIEINKILAKNENLKNRTERFNAERRCFFQHPVSDFEPEEQYRENIETLKQKRLVDNQAIFNPRFKLNLGNGYSLVTDEIKNPKIVPTRSLFNKGLIRKVAYDKDSVSSETERKDKANTMTFSMQVPLNLRRSSFSIDSCWKDNAQSWKHRRIKNRHDLGK